MIKDPGK